MADYDKEVVTPLLRRRAHLEEVGADAAKKAELDHQLRMAGYPVDDMSPLSDDKRVEQDKPGVPRAEKEVPPNDADTERDAKRVKPMERSAKPVTTASPSKPEAKA